MEGEREGRGEERGRAPSTGERMTHAANITLAH